jgi:hypothetical protein
MIVKVKFMSREYEFDVEPYDKVYTLKEKVSEKVGIENIYIRLCFDGIPLKKDKTFDEQSVKPDSKIIAVYVAGPGG